MAINEGAIMRREVRSLGISMACVAGLASAFVMAQEALRAVPAETTAALSEAPSYADFEKALLAASSRRVWLSKGKSCGFFSAIATAE